MILLELFKNKNIELVFKGGTLLNKAYTGFYRLSEDLDFTLPTSPDSTRGQRSNSMKKYKDFFGKLQNLINNIKIKIELTGSNNSLQYNGELTYKSCFEGINGRILFEVGLREEPIEKAVYNNLKTLITDPYSDKKISSQKAKFLPLSKDRKIEMIKVLDLQLKPVLRTDDYEKFNFDAAWNLLIQLKEFIEPKVR